MADSSVPKPPPGAGRGGARLWREVLDTFELAPHEQAQLREIVLTIGLTERLERKARSAPLTVAGQGGTVRTHPLVTELRQQRITLARLLAALRLPDDFDAEQAMRDPDRPQHRGGARGVYAIAGGGG